MAKFILEVTLTFLSKKHVNFGEGLDFLKFSQGNREESTESQRKIKEIK